jgi:hypothetical protein
MKECGAKRLIRFSWRASLLTFAAALAFCGFAGTARAQEIMPNEFVPAPNGTNLAIGYFQYGSLGDYHVNNGPTIHGSGGDAYFGVARYVHYTYVGGMPAGFQIIEPFGAIDGAHIGEEHLNDASGAQSPALSAFIWPYSNAATNTHLVVTGFIYPPMGTFNKNDAVNVNTPPDSVWKGDFQVGLHKGFGESLSFDASIDERFFGDLTLPGGERITTNPDTRAQIWVNYAWNKALTTSVGFEGLYGGNEKAHVYVQQLNTTFGEDTGTSNSEQKIRAAAQIWLSPRWQATIEVNHDISRDGGFTQDFGATARVLFVF